MGVLQILLVIAVIGIAIIKQVNKKIGETSGDNSTPRTPSARGKEQGNAKPTLPESWGQWFPMEKQNRPIQLEVTPKVDTVASMAEAAHPKNQIKETPPTPQKENRANSDSPPQNNHQKDFGIHSSEDLRQAIIWSEILQRKY